MKLCIKCGVVLNSENTTWYRQKNYIHKCNCCTKVEKREQAAKRHSRVPDHIAALRRKYTKNMKELDPVKYSCKQMAASAKKRSTALGLDYNISTSYLIEISPVICPILGVEIKYGGGDRDHNSASIDRVDSSKGYTKDNVQIVSLLANLMKSNANVMQMRKFAKWVINSYGL